MSKIKLIATSAFGLEAVVAREVRELGFEDVEVENGKVTFSAEPEGICRANLWLRTADRVLLKVGQFKAESFEALFEGTKSLPWPDWITEDGNFPVTGKSINSKLFSVPDCQAIVKKAIVEKMKTCYRKDWFSESGPRFKVEVALLKDIATLTIDTSGAGLHKRGYRKLGSEAPLRETLAAALILLSRWTSQRVLIDPFCGSGTIPIEAALIGLSIAPGINRGFDAENWPSIPVQQWDKTREEARDLIDFQQTINIQGYDIDSKVLSLARYHASQAGVSDYVTFQERSLDQLSSRYKYGYIVCNPPYGVRIGEQEEVDILYREMGNKFKKMETWSYYVLTSHPEFERLFGEKADKKRKLYNGKILCNLFQYFGPRPPRRDSMVESITLEKRESDDQRPGNKNHRD
ncbi:MAG: class I SAM-dependent RNA methyltransferase [Peptococcaceae bacterium]|nr:class I SAM-dependent RNA methyltransferase [Peptococcaceae bacterium]